MVKHNSDIQHLKNKTVVITGASSGAGRAAAIEFAKEQSNLVVAARNQTALEQLVNECAAFGAKAIAVQTDVTKPDQQKKLAETANDYFGKIDIWINNAGVLAAGSFTKTPVEIHTQVINTNLLGYINGTYAVLPFFKKQGYGILINNISVGGWYPVPYASAYSSSKFGLKGFFEALKGEMLYYKNIHICDLFPAFLDTPGIKHAANYTGKILKPAPPVYDPFKVARAMVAVAKNPKKSTTVGSVASLLRFAHFLAPGLSRSITAMVMKKYFDIADAAPHTTGNVFHPLDYGTSIHGGWSNKAQKTVYNKSYRLLPLFAGIAVSFILINKISKNK